MERLPKSVTVCVLDQTELFRQIVDLLPFGAYLVDTSRKVLYWNHRAEHITGFLSHEIVGKSCADDVLAHCSVNGTAVCQSGGCPVAQVLRDGHPVEARLLLRHKQGHRVPILVRSLPLKDESGRIVAIAEIFQEESAGPAGLLWVTENIHRFDIDLGLPSAVATRAQLQFSLTQGERDQAAFLIEIEGLKQMTANRGREMANTAVRTLAHTISKMLTVPHYMGCWSGSRLLLLVPNCKDPHADTLRENLEIAGSSCGINWWGERVALRVKAKAVRPDAYESVEDVLRALEDIPAGEERKCL